MAEKPNRRVRKAASVREVASQLAAKPKADQPKHKLKGISKYWRAVRRAIAKPLRPFRFLLWPFKTRVVKFVGKTLATITGLRFVWRSWRELKDVKWPSRKETTQLTVAVFVFALIFGIIITVTDYGLDKLFKKILLK